MSATVYRFNAKENTDVKEALEEALKFEFDEVVVIGIKGTEVFTNKSANASTITWLGMLAYLQQFLYNRMAGFE